MALIRAGGNIAHLCLWLAWAGRAAKLAGDLSTESIGSRRRLAGAQGAGRCGSPMGREMEDGTGGPASSQAGARGRHFRRRWARADGGPWAARNAA